jgi:hypothetical protein
LKNNKSFSEFKLFILARTFMEILHRRVLKFVGSSNLLSKVPKFWYLIAEIRQHWLDFGNHCWNSATAFEIRQPRFKQKMLKSNRCKNLTIWTRFRLNWQESGHLCLISTTFVGIQLTQILIKLVEIWSLRPNFGLHRLNMMKVAKILSASDRILSPVIFYR